MTCPTVKLGDRELIILIDLDTPSRAETRGRKRLLRWGDLPAVDQLKRAAAKDTDAMVFSFVGGCWFAAA